MVSTYLSYDLINRDMKASLSRVSQQGLIERQTAYYKENIGNVKSVDEFLDNYQLYSYAMDAFGLGEMTYAKAFMKKVLDSDLNDQNSFANKLTDERYREFAAAFNFTSSTKTVQTEAQLDKMIGLYDTSITDLNDSLAEETRYYKAIIGTVTNVDQLLRNDRTRAYIFQVFGVDEKTYSYAHIKGLMTSDINDPDSYINQKYGAAYNDAVEKLTMKGNIELHAQVTARITAIDTELAGTGLTNEERTKLEAEKVTRQDQLTQLEAVLPPKDEWEAKLAAIKAEQTTLSNTVTQYNKMAQIANAFEFKNDGTVTAGAAQTADNLKAFTDSYIGSAPRVTPTVATLNRDYFESKIGSVTTVEELMSDARLLNYIRTAFDLNDLTIVPATIKNILTSDLSDPNNYIATMGKNDKRYLALKNAFNFLPDGTLAAGTTPQTATQTATTTSGYMTHYNDADEAADAKALSLFKSSIGNVTSVNDFLGTNAVYTYALKAVGLDPAKVNISDIQRVLTSDLQDKKSYVYTLKDDRYVKLAELFNFTKDGSVGSPILAQSEIELQTMSADYIKKKSAFGTDKDKETATTEAKYFSGEMQKIKTLSEFLANDRLTKFAMESLGIDPESVTKEQLEKIFTSKLDDKDSYVNKEMDPVFRRLVTAFNFNTDGTLLHEDRSLIQTRRGLYETLDNYLTQTLETQAGEENAGVRLALYFQRMAAGTTSYYSILADTAIQSFINTTFGIPDELANADVDTQVTMMEKYFDIQDFQDPDKVKKLIARFTIMYDSQQNTTDPIMMLFNGSGSAGISGDTLLAVATLRAR
ncbi:MAG: flagellar protein [Agrobacterium fabrum]|uniref:Flagellar protein n=1 Tax=Agrobacterium fabrum TaxID=1176649 RepID=A0A2W5ETE8_9HYPH|nr:MAG: flagellar protein [Agrobacterium fabrum]